MYERGEIRKVREIFSPQEASEKRSKFRASAEGTNDSLQFGGQLFLDTPSNLSSGYPIILGLYLAFVSGVTRGSRITRVGVVDVAPNTLVGL